MRLIFAEPWPRPQSLFVAAALLGGVCELPANPARELILDKRTMEDKDDPLASL
jgi:hypothetical protein